MIFPAASPGLLREKRAERINIELRPFLPAFNACLIPSVLLYTNP